MQKTNTIKNSLKGLFFYAALIIAWQVIAVLGSEVFGFWKTYTFPNPMGVVESFLQLIRKGSIFLAIAYSMKRALIGFFLAIVAGTIFGVLITNYAFLNKNLKPLLMGIQALPSVCWVPFAILWFGLKESAIIFVVVMGSVFSISLAIENAIRNIPPIYIKAARTMGASKKDLYLHVIFPAAFPGFIAGLKQGWSFAWRALMSGEVMSAVVGLGYTLNLGRDMADINQVMAVMIIIIIVGIVIDKYIFSVIEYKILKKRGMI
ncbi:MAG: ABC transporter permease [Lachnospiraceae bacterium]|nr:ABC transporter permease [Lachnospiraceae bacterium]